ncbi:hypothetical protein H7F51_07295 [Novosphingobium flavum]|uniref:histidine kinase n=1 Tax=Novosphingobium flavum TaxID=1778672 RepID=A0A7X1FQW2_9SPHN|nr:ATP-binding protein [Novosphingobium flavum]MBC2665320.1 hypothetical protein [Novosphingobium flavum]
MKLRSFWARFDSLATRMTLFLALGATLAAITSLTLAERYRQNQMRLYRAERITQSARGLVGLLTVAPQRTRAELAGNRVQGAHLLENSRAPVRESDPAVSAALSRAFAPDVRAGAFSTDPQVCLARPVTTFARRAAGYLGADTECWIVTLTFARPVGGESELVLALDLAALPRPATLGLSPGFILIVAAASLVLSFLVAQVTLGFMRRLTKAAQAFANDIEAPPVAETGPRDVRTTFAAFNHMQQRIRDAVRDRTQILAAITHDLQTPLTRLRLRLELVPEEGLRNRLVADIAAMQRLVTEGLVLARSGEASDDWALVDVESLLASVVEDAADAGQPSITLGRVEPLEIRVKPEALQRCLQNLVDNALRYGGSARLDCTTTADEVQIAVSDNGPGIPEHLLGDVFKPFVRAEGSRSRQTGGTGIGLTIARAQAETFGGRVQLANRPDGGLVATIAVPRR